MFYSWSNLDKDFMKDHLKSQIKALDKEVIELRNKYDDIRIKLYDIRMQHRERNEEYKQLEKERLSAYRKIKVRMRHLAEMHKKLREYE